MLKDMINLDSGKLSIHEINLLLNFLCFCQFEDDNMVMNSIIEGVDLLKLFQDNSKCSEADLEFIALFIRENDIY